MDAIIGSYGAGVTLLTNRTTVETTARIIGTSSGQTGVYGPSSIAWVLSNSGRIVETLGTGYGILFAGTGTITNAAAGYISASEDGIVLGVGGAVTNLMGGTIRAVNYALDIRSAAGTVVNNGYLGGNGLGVFLGGGGSLTNQAAGSIAGYMGLSAVAGMLVVNGGYIGGSPVFQGAGIVFGAGGTITNQTDGTIAGNRAVTAAGALTVYNSGTIVAPDGGDAGIWLSGGGSVTNQTSGHVVAAYPIIGGEFAATVTNYGIVGNGDSDKGVSLGGGGLVSNKLGGTINGYYGVFAVNAAATVVNAGSIDGGSASTQVGVYLRDGGTVTNLSGGRISAYHAVYINGDAGTVVNAGTISGGGFAVRFAAGYTDRLVIHPGAVFTGLVNGGNTIGATSVSTLELAPGGPGTITGLGTQFINFAQGTIDTGANWTLSGTNSLAAGETMTNGGTLTAIGTLTNSGTLTGVRLGMKGGSLTNQTNGVVTTAYIYGVPGGGADTVVNHGSITGSGNFAIFLAASGTVSNAAGGVITSPLQAVKVSDVGAVVTNLGQIDGAVGVGGGVGVYMPNGGNLTNGLSGASPGTASIQGYTGIEMNSLGTLNNYGTILSAVTGGTAAEFLAGAVVVNGATNATAALLQGYALGVYAQSGTITNYATIISTGIANDAIDMIFSATVSNLGGASLIEGHVGVNIADGGTITNAGTIEFNQGTAGVAVNFAVATNRLIVDPGASFIGSIAGGTAVMELAAGSPGSIYGFGTSITNFTSIVFDSSAQWTIGGNDSASGLGTLAITGFTAGDTIDLTGFVAVSDTFTSGVLVLTNGGGSHATLNVAGAFTSGDFLLSGGAGSGTDIIVCFAKGTRIATPRGERRIELMAPGDLVRTHFAGPAAIQWIGRRHVDCVRHPDPRLAWPVRVAANAMGPGCPGAICSVAQSRGVYSGRSDPDPMPGQRCLDRAGAGG